MATNINLGTIAAGATFAALDETKITIGGQTLAALGVAPLAGTETSITIPGYGVLAKTGAGATVSFTAAAAATGSFTLTNNVGATVTFTSADFSNAAGASVATTAVGTDAGSTLTTLVGGGGNDTLTVTKAATLTGGTGADKFVQTVVANGLTVTDYYYGQGDAVTLAGSNAAGAGTLTGAGAFTGLVGDLGVAAVTVKDVAADGAYKVKVTATTSADTKEFWTAKTGTSAITLDGSASTSALEINTNNATNAVVTGSVKADNISLGTSQVTLNAGVNAGSDLVTGFNDGFSGDVLNLNGYTLSDVSWGALATGTATIGTTASLTGAVSGFGSAGEGKILVQENGGTVKKVEYAAAAAQALAVSDADVYMATGAAIGTTTLNAAGVVTNGTVINFQDTDKYRNLSAITGATNASGYYIGLADSLAGGTTINLAGSTKVSEVWGGSKAVDTIALKGNNGVQDIIYFGTADGNDLLTGFKTGFAATADVVNLYDVADVSKVSFSNVGTVGIKAATGSILSLTAVDAPTTNSVQLQLKNSAGTVKKVAAAINALAASTIDGVGADLVIGQEAQLNDTVTYGTAQTANVVVNLLDTTAYKNVENVDLTGATGSYNVVVGSGSAASNITLAGATAEVWGGSKNADAITAGSGTDTIWYGANDGADAVTGFTAGTDKVKFYDKSVAAVASAYTWNGTAFGSTTKAADTLTLGAGVANKTIDILDKDNKAAKVALAGAANLTYVKGTDIYMGTGLVGGNQLNVTGSENVVLYLGNGVDATVNDIYFSGVTAINAATATGETVLIGSATGNDVLTAGKTTSAMWGGGSAADTMVGGIGTDQYWFGAGDGADKVTAGVDKKDTIVLYNAASIADVTMTVDAVAGNFVVTAADGSKLTVTDAAATALDGGLTFQFGVNESAKSYTYDRIAKNFIAK